MKNNQNEQSLIHAEVLRRFHYEPTTGIVTRLVKTSNKVNIGDIVGTLDNGHLSTQINGINYKLHRIIWFYVYGVWPEHQIDHRDKNRSNNRIANLRLSNDQLNRTNMSKQKRNTSGTTGVIWFQQTKRWKAVIQFKYKQHHLGYFVNKDDAIKARKDAEILYGFTND